MATYTSNLNLKKPALDDDALITDINNNMDILDAAANGIEDALAIVANGNTHAAITSGQFVYVRNHNTLTEGLYVASSNIAANATLSSSNLTADSKGGLNALSEQMASNSITQIVNSDIAVSGDTAWHDTGNDPVSFSSGYKRYLVRCSVHGALINSGIISQNDLSVLSSSYPFTIACYWDDNNLGDVQIFGSNGNKYFGIAKTKDMKFDIEIYGIN